MFVDVIDSILHHHYLAFLFQYLYQIQYHQFHLVSMVFLVLLVLVPYYHHQLVFFLVLFLVVLLLPSLLAVHSLVQQDHYQVLDVVFAVVSYRLVHVLDLFQ